MPLMPLHFLFMSPLGCLHFHGVWEQSDWKWLGLREPCDALLLDVADHMWQTQPGHVRNLQQPGSGGTSWEVFLHGASVASGRTLLSFHTRIRMSFSGDKQPHFELQVSKFFWSLGVWLVLKHPSHTHLVRKSFSPS